MLGRFRFDPSTGGARRGPPAGAGALRHTARARPESRPRANDAGLLAPRSGPGGTRRVRRGWPAREHARPGRVASGHGECGVGRHDLHGRARWAGRLLRAARGSGNARHAEGMRDALGPCPSNRARGAWAPGLRIARAALGSGPPRFGSEVVHVSVVVSMHPPGRTWVPRHSCTRPALSFSGLGAGRDAEIRSLRAKVGELMMDTELLEAFVDRVDPAHRPPLRRPKS